VLLPCSQDDLVIDVGNVHDKDHLKLEVVGQYATNDIGRDIISGMAQVL